ncbi:MAG: hypothetical protein HZB16_11020 [Armatimonadetes bacterium]|nr:hypothetical protein [Armatimonadota bacterium]
MSAGRILSLAVIALLLGGQARALSPEGIVYEAEAVASPRDAWRKDQRGPSFWCLWTAEEDIASKRSGGAVLASPPTATERARPEDGAPALHCVITDLKPGAYRVFVSSPGARPLGYSLDGQRWRPYAGAELALGLRDLRDGRFEIWIDDRYPHPAVNAGSGYFDYIRFVPARPGEVVRPPSIDHLTVAPGELAWTTSGQADEGTVVFQPGDIKRTVTTTGRNHFVRLDGLGPAVRRATITMTIDGREVSAETSLALPLPAGGALDVPLTWPAGTQSAGPTPVVMGLPFPRGVVAEPGELALLADGTRQPLQADLQARWPDGSVKWAVLSFVAEPRAKLRLTRSAVSPATTWLKVNDDAEAWRVDTGSLAFDLGRRLPALFARLGWDRNADGRVADDERIAAAPLGANVKLELGDGSFCTLGPPSDLRREVDGPLRVVLLLTGPLVSQAGPAGWSYELRLTLWRGGTDLAIDLGVIRDQAQPAFAPINALALRLPLDAAGGVRGALDGQAEQPAGDADGQWILQDTEKHFVRRDGLTTRGVAGLATVRDDRSQVAVVMRDFQQAYPSGYAIKPDGLHIRLLPPLPADQYQDAASRPVWGKLYSWCRSGRYQVRAGQMLRREVQVHFGPLADAGAWAKTYQDAPRPTPSAAYLCATAALGRALLPRTAGTWDVYDAWFDRGFDAYRARREADRAYGFMNYGDWYGERGNNWGNNEYDAAATLALHWMRDPRPELFADGLATARHVATIDTLHGAPAAGRNGLLWEHSFNHVGTDLTGDSPELAGTDMSAYLARYGRSMFTGAIDPQGHHFVGGLWLYGALAGDLVVAEQARRISENQAAMLTRNFDFGIERAGGWPLINMVHAYAASGRPYYLNAARLMIARALERQDPATGGWLHNPPLDETDGEKVLGGKAFAVGILTHGILRYLEQEPARRPDVEKMLQRGVDWLQRESWNPDKGFRYISNSSKYKDTGERGLTALMVAEAIVAARQFSGDQRYLDFAHEVLRGVFDKPLGGMGKGFTQGTRQTIFALDRLRELGEVALK